MFWMILSLSILTAIFQVDLG